MVAPIAGTPQGSQRRLVVTKLDEEASVLYRDFDVPRGKLSEQPIGVRKNGLRAERLSACGFCAPAFGLLVPTWAYAVVVLFGEASASVLEVATARVRTLRQRLGKVGAVVVTGVRRICFHFSERWPYRGVGCRVLCGVNAFVAPVAWGGGVEDGGVGMRKGRVASWADGAVSG